MAGIPAESSRGGVHPGVVQALLGLAAGALIYYAAAVAWAVLTVGGFGAGPLATIAISILAGLTVFVGVALAGRRPAGVLILAFVLFAGLTGISSGLRRHCGRTCLAFWGTPLRAATRRLSGSY